VHAAEQPQGKNARRPVIEVPAQHIGGRAAVEKILGGVGKEITVEPAAEFAASVGLKAEQARSAYCSYRVWRRTLHGRHYDRATRSAAISAPGSGFRLGRKARVPRWQKKLCPDRREAPPCMRCRGLTSA
jgi:hypothetical protein